MGLKSKRGIFIAFEGGEGAGKSTQAKLLSEALAQRGMDVVLTREPGGTIGAETIRALLLTIEGEGWLPRAEALLFAAARSDHVERKIRPALESGISVICDRYLDSSRAYQGGGSGLTDDDLLTLHKIGSQGLLPDITILIDIEPEIVAQRLALRDMGKTDRIGGRSAEYHARVQSAFRAFAQNEPARFLVINGNGSPDQTHRSVMQAMMSLLERQSI